ncbi:MAG TPA: hypothetical protein VKB76_04085, partial [Ktedonobacterales bacterium]|nr:hypothetical protein [Ktedonobacterales bacterium]
MTRGDHRVAKDIHLIFRFLKAQHQCVAQGQHSEHMLAFDDRKMTEVVYSHEVLRRPHCVIRSARDDSRGHDVAGTHILQFTPVRSRKNPHKIALGDEAGHVAARFANGHRANAMCVKKLGNTRQRVVRPASHNPLTGVLEKLTNLHGVPPYSFLIGPGVCCAIKACTPAQATCATTILPAG